MLLLSLFARRSITIGGEPAWSIAFFERFASAHPKRWSGTRSRSATLELAENRRQGNPLPISLVQSEGRLGSATGSEAYSVVFRVANKETTKHTGLTATVM